MLNKRKYMAAFIKFLIDVVISYFCDINECYHKAGVFCLKRIFSQLSKSCDHVYR